VQLIDASGWFSPLRRNLGQKNCELSDADIERIIEAFLAFVDTEQSKVFENAHFGYRKVKVERPLRLRSQCSPELVEQLRFASGDQGVRAELYEQFGDRLFDDFDKARADVDAYLSGPGDDEDEAEPPVKPAVRKRLLDGKRWARDKRLHTLGERLAEELGTDVFDGHNVFAESVDEVLKASGQTLAAADRKTLLRTLSWRDEAAPPVVKKVTKRSQGNPRPVARAIRHHRRWQARCRRV